MYDFLIEEAISEASCYDIGMEQYFAEMEVLSALSEAYSKQLQMATYYQEGEVGDTLKVAGVAAGVGAIGLGAAAVWLITLPFRIIINILKMFVSVIKEIIRFFTGANKATPKNIKKLIRKLEDLSEEEKAKFSIPIVHDFISDSVINSPKNNIANTTPARINKATETFLNLTDSDDPLKDMDKWEAFAEELTSICQTKGFDDKVKDAYTKNGAWVKIGYDDTLQLLNMLLKISESIPKYQEAQKRVEKILKEKQAELEKAKSEKDDLNNKEASDIKIKSNHIQTICKSYIDIMNRYLKATHEWYRNCYKYLMNSNKDLGKDVSDSMRIIG